VIAQEIQGYFGYGYGVIMRLIHPKYLNPKGYMECFIPVIQTGKAVLSFAGLPCRIQGSYPAKTGNPSTELLKPSAQSPSQAYLCRKIQAMLHQVCLILSIALGRSNRRLA
jgi:hypothetical protein